MTASDQYSDDLITGKIPAGDPMLKAAKRFVSDRQRKDIYFDEADAERYCDFIEEALHLWEGKWRGENVKLFPFQKFIIQNFFGWKRLDGKRRFRDVYIQTAKKNGKTTLMSAIALAHLIIDETEPTPQIIVGANNEEQAKLCVNSCGKMVDVSPVLFDLEDERLLSRLKYGDEFYRISYKGDFRDGSIKAISKDVKTKAGKNPSLVIIDEYMAATKDDLYKELRNAQQLRDNPGCIVITTPGFNKQNPCYSKLRKRAIDMLNGTSVDDSLFAAVFEIPEDKWEDENEWPKSSPIINHIPSVLDILRIDHEAAKAEGGTSIVDFKTKNLGIWCDAASVWIPNEFWIKNHNPKLKPEDIEGEGFGGLDIAATRDLISFSAVFPNAFELKGKAIKAVRNWNWLPHDNIIYRGMDYSKFVQDRWIKLTPGNHSEPDTVLNDLNDIVMEHDIRNMFYDQPMSNWLPPMMARSGIEVYPISMKGFKQSEAMKRFERMMYGEEIEHFDNPVLKWALSNTIAKFDNQGQHIRPEKEHENNKIDPAVATILSFDCWMYKEIQPKKAAPSIIGLEW